jgi:hypothetical protein
MQCFTVWITMQFVHVCCLSLNLQFQYPGQRSHRGGSASRTKDTATMSPGRRHSKRVNSTRLGEFAHGVCTRRAATGKREEVSVVGEHNSPSQRTLEPRDQFKVHELTRDICWDVTLPSPMRDCPQLDDDSHAEEEPSKQTPVSHHPQNNESCLSWYYLIDIYLSINSH